RQSPILQPRTWDSTDPDSVPDLQKPEVRLPNRPLFRGPIPDLLDHRTPPDTDVRLLRFRSTRLVRVSHPRPQLRTTSTASSWVPPRLRLPRLCEVSPCPGLVLVDLRSRHSVGS